MALRTAFILLGVATVTCVAAGWGTRLDVPLSFVSDDNDQVVTITYSTCDVFDPDSQPTPKAPDNNIFATKIEPFLKKYCVDCHSGDKAKGGLSLDVYMNEAHARKDRKNWGAVQHVLAAGEMPPKESKKPKPTKEEKELVIDWIENTLTKVDCSPDTPKDPGRVTIRRLNRAEYNNTIRDLCAVDFKPADDFPSDDVGYGFDNIGDVLSFQPILLEKYMSAADKILAKALEIPELPKKDKQTFEAQNIEVTVRGAKLTNPDRIIFKTNGEGSPGKLHFYEGEYILRFRGWGTKVGDQYPKVAIRVDGKDVETFTIEAEQNKPQTYEVKVKLPAGENKRVAVAFTNPSEDKDKDKPAREFGLISIEKEGPFNPVPPPESASVKFLLVARPGEKLDHRRAAEEVIANFARRAYRRPVMAEEVRRIMKLYDIAVKQGEPFEKAIRLPMKAILVSPNFLYRIEEDPKDPIGIRTISDFEFATRLSYFLWSSMPDEELFTLAENRELRKPKVLEAQVKRMLKDPKAKALSENFAGQWLQLRSLNTIAPDKGYYPNWDDDLKKAMAGEAEAYFEHVVKNDRSIVEFLDSDYTFVNNRLAKHYDIKSIYGPTFQKVTLTDGRRGGVITMASTLTVTSNPTRTSPVKRGKWILENILGTPPPPPAPDVPELPPTGQLKGTLRQQMEQHRADPKCAVCHAKLDPLGFGLENFDGIGGWRTQDNKQAIDPTGELPGGEKFAGPAELRKVLLGKADMFRRCFAEKLMTFGLGRGLEYYDKCALDKIVATAKTNGDTFSSLVLAIVKSDPFQKRKGKRSE